MAIAIKWYGNDILKKIDKQNIDLIRCIARTISRTAKQLCPVKTSTLRRSIRAVVTKDIAKVQAGGTWLVGGVATPVEYAGYVELGTSKNWEPAKWLHNLIYVLLLNNFQKWIWTNALVL